MAAKEIVPQTQDISFAVQGYVTDPKLVGYQILTNYESTYWAPLIGNDAWRLYEVLRSFCHEGNSTCYPSINLLVAILGIKDRSVLIGRAKPKIVKGKEYYYPGLIQTLQEHDLAVAEVQGEGPKLRYIFHVNLTPGLLSEAMLARLPKLLQKKHRQLIERCEQEKRTLAAKKRPSKLAQKPPEEGESGGIGNSNTPLGNSNTPSWNFQYKQYPYNNTQETEANARDGNNNNSSDDEAKQSVVVALTHYKISKRVAQKLADRYSLARISEKIEYLEFLNDESPDRIQNPRGWLRSAIEEDYGPPDGYLSQEERQQLALAAQRADREAAEREQAAEDERRAFEAKRQTAQKTATLQLRAEYGTTEADLAFWEEAQQDIRLTLAPELAALVIDAQILKREGTTVVIGLASERQWRQLQHPGTKKVIQKALGVVAGGEVDLETRKIAWIAS